MSKKQAKTLLEKMGFKDDDLSTPKHDEIMLWLDRNIEAVINESLLADETTTEHKRWAIRQHCPQETVNLLQAQWFKCIDKTWEKPVTTRTNYTIGFVDLFAEFRGVGFKWRETNTFPVEDVWSFEPNALWITCAFEIKSYIDSVGALIRQIRAYQVHAETTWRSKPAPIWVVVSPDSRFEDTLMQQGIYHITYAPKRFI